MSNAISVNSNKTCDKVIQPAIFRGHDDVQPFDPYDLFINGRTGTYYDQSDPSTVFQDAAGTTPTTLETPNALMLDKSQGLVLGPELVTNGTFGTDTGWSKGSGWSIAGGKLVASSSPLFSSAQQPIAGVGGGRLFEISYTVSDYVSGSVKLNFTGDGEVNSVTASANGVYAQRIRLNQNTNTLKIESVSGTAALSCSIDNISVKLLPGNHASQPTTTKRPVLSSRVNWFSSTADLGVSPWFNVQGVSTYVNNKIIPAATTLVHGRRYTFQQVAGRVITISFWVKAGESGINCELWTYSTRGAVINLETWSVTSVANCTVSLGEFDSEGYRRVWYTSTDPASTSNNTDFRVTRSTLRDQQFVGDGVSGYYLKNPQLEYGSTATAFQWVTTSTSYDTDGFPLYLNYDADDELITTFPAALGSNCTIGIAVQPAATILTGQTVDATYVMNTDNYAVVIVDDALTPEETANLTEWLNNKARN